MASKKPHLSLLADPKKVIVLNSQLIVTVGVYDGDEVGEKFNIPVDFSPLSSKGFADAEKAVRARIAELTAQINAKE